MVTVQFWCVYMDNKVITTRSIHQKREQAWEDARCCEEQTGIKHYVMRVKTESKGRLARQIR